MKPQMLDTLRNLLAPVIIGESVPRLVRWGKAAPRSLIRRLQADAFRGVVRYAAKHQRFFARKLEERGIDPARVQEPEDLGDVFTTPEDLQRLPAEDFLCRAPQAVYETTGTSAVPKRVYFNYGELEAAGRYEAAALWENGVRPGDRVVCTFDPGYWLSSWVTFLGCKGMKLFCSAVGKPTPWDFYPRLAVYRYNVIIADPTWLVSLTEIAEREGTVPMKLMVAAGDRMTDVYRSYVQKVWQAPVVLGYGSTEAGGGLGMECRRREGYHLDEFNFFIEIVDPDDEGYGELVMTTLSRRTQPFIRYRMRDIARFNNEPCPCGAPLRRISRIKGRRDEMVVMGAGNLHPEIFDRVLHDVVGISEGWQVAVRQEGLRDILEFRLVLNNGTKPGWVEEAVRRNLEAHYPDLWANQACGMYKLAFSFLPPGDLEHRRKPKRLVDERQS